LFLEKTCHSQRDPFGTLRGFGILNFNDPINMSPLRG
jgi:hypothetical protein